MAVYNVGHFLRQCSFINEFHIVHNVPHCRILSPDKTEWRLISATLGEWRRFFVADQLWLMTCIWEDEEWVKIHNTTMATAACTMVKQKK